MSDPWQRLIDASRQLDHGSSVSAVAMGLLDVFDAAGASNEPAFAVAEFLRALTWVEEADDVDDDD